LVGDGVTRLPGSALELACCYFGRFSRSRWRCSDRAACAWRWSACSTGS